MKLGGLDIGTTGCKLTVFDENGNTLAKAYRDYPANRSDRVHEIPAAAMRESIYAVMTEIGAQHPDIRGIGVTSFGEAFVPVDRNGAPLYNPILYTDPRGRDECSELVKQVGKRKIIEITGLVPHEMYSLSKLMWLKKHRPDIFAQTAKVLLIEDYAVFELTHRAQIDYSLAARTMAFDIRTLNWSEELFDAAGIDPALMSTPVMPGTAAGPLTPEAAARTGINRDCIIVSACHDQVASAVGAGAFTSDIAVDGSGTCECLVPVYDGLPNIDVMAQGGFSSVPYVVPGKYVAYALCTSGGVLIDWCMHLVGRGETYKEIEEAYGKDMPSGLLVLPHFTGASNPYMDIDSKGAVLGLTTSTSAPELFRACMEGIAYEMKLNIEALAGSGIRFSRIHATGGGAKSAIWLQIKADILNMPVTALKTANAGTTGSAMLTGIAVGLYRDLDEAASILVKTDKTYYPRPEQHARYMEVYERYKKVYDAVRPLV